MCIFITISPSDIVAPKNVLDKFGKSNSSVYILNRPHDSVEFKNYIELVPNPTSRIAKIEYCIDLKTVFFRE